MNQLAKFTSAPHDPVTSPSPIGEPSFADVVAAIDADPVLANGEGRFWKTSLRQMAGYLGLPLELLPARIPAIGPRIAALHAERLNLNAKTFANHRSSVKKALNWFKDNKGGYGRKAPMDAAYRDLLSLVDNRHHRDLLSPFFRYLSKEGIDPLGVTDEHVDDYAKFRFETGFNPIRNSAVRSLVKYWNLYAQEIEAWPDQCLRVPDRGKKHDGPSLETFPDGLKADIEAVLDARAKPRRSATGKRLKPCKASTLERIRRQLVALVRKSVAIGIPLEELTSLSILLQPNQMERVIDAYWADYGEEPGSYTIDLADLVLSLAREHCDLSEPEIERLIEIRDQLAEYRTTGLTEKNREIVRHVLAGNLWPKVLGLPRQLMAAAEADRRASNKSYPIKAAVNAQMAVAIHLLTVAPVRIGNLAMIRLQENLVRPGGPGTPYVLIFPGYDVKNHVDLEFPLSMRTSDLIDLYLHHHRPALMRGLNHDYLFPGEGKPVKDVKTLGDQITRRLEKHLGIHLTPHQFRHAAGAIILQAHPGNYELVRRVLGHRSIQTTTNFYIGLESLSATRRFGELVTGMMPEQKCPSRKVRR